WERDLTDKDLVYNLSGRYPTSLFSAFKLVGLRKVYPELFDRVTSFTSISEWILYQFSGIVCYEHSQASETLLYDVEAKIWSSELLKLFDLPSSILPPLKDAASVLGTVLPVVTNELNIASDAVVVV